MKFGFIGAGKVGFSLGKYFAVHDLDVVGYYSDKLEDSLEAAEFTNSKSYDSLDENLAKENIDKLKEYGFTFSLDDYGTGYSNIERFSVLLSTLVLNVLTTSLVAYVLKLLLIASTAD